MNCAALDFLLARSSSPALRSRARLPVALAAASALIASANPSHAQEPAYSHVQGGFVTWPWVWQDPSDPSHYRVWTSEDGARIRFYDSDTGAWVFQSTPASQTKTYRFIAFHDNGETGIAVGDGGHWAWINNGHDPAADWRADEDEYIEHPRLPTLHPRIWAVHVRPGEYWVVGERGLLARTDQLNGDALEQVNDCPLPPPALCANPKVNGPDPFEDEVEFHGIDFTADGVVGAAVGNTPDGEARIYYTTDSGDNWALATITFLDEACAPISSSAAEPVKLWKVSFGKGEGDLVGHVVGMALTDSNPSYNEGRVFRTVNGQPSAWIEEPYEYDCCTSCTMPQCQSPSAPCSSTMFTQDVTFETLPEMYAVHTFDDGGAIAVGYGATVIERLPSSSTWLSHTDRCEFPTGPLWGVHGDGDSTAWTTGHSNQIRRTDDRGTTWVQQGWDAHWRLGAMATVSTGGSSSGPVLWAVGQQRRIARSLDGGVSWTEQHGSFNPDPLLNLEFGLAISGVAVFDDGDDDVGNDFGVAVGSLNNQSNWMILRTETGGDGCAWSPVVPNIASPQNLSAVCVSGVGSQGKEFWAVGAQGTILVSRNGGQSWTKLTSPISSVTWRGVTFSNLNDGWIVGVEVIGQTTQGRSVRVTQGSTTPVLTLLPTTTPLKAVDSYQHQGGTTQCYAVGDDGSVFKFKASATPPQFELQTTASALTDKTLLAVQVLSRTGGGHVVFAGGLDGVALRFDGTTWSTHPKSQTSSDIVAMAFLGDGDGFALGNDGEEAEIGAQSTLVRYSNQ